MASPALSVVLGTPGDYSTIATTVRHLQRQSIAGRLELIVVGRTPDAVGLDGRECEPFWGHQVLGVGPPVTVARANAAGVRAARAPVVALAEDHCFPEPAWAEALVERHAGGDVAAVGPVVQNANPGTLVSWCDFAVGYGRWCDPTMTGDQPFLPGHNSSYQRAVLLQLGDALEDFLGAETVLHLALREQGHRLVIEPRARVAHTNFGRIGSWLPAQYHHGRVFAAERARHWGPARRAFYAAASPLIPWVRLARAIGHLRRSGRPRPSLPRLAPLLGLGLATDGLGQFLGYLAGAGSSTLAVSRFEFRRVDHVGERDRQLWAEAGSAPPPGRRDA